CSTASNTSPSWQATGRGRVEAADVAEPEGLRVRDEEHHRQPEQRLNKRRQPLQLNAETILRRRRCLPEPGETTTRSYLCTLFRRALPSDLGGKKSQEAQKAQEKRTVS